MLPLSLRDPLGSYSRCSKPRVSEQDVHKDSFALFNDVEERTPGTKQSKNLVDHTSGRRLRSISSPKINMLKPAENCVVLHAGTKALYPPKKVASHAHGEGAIRVDLDEGVHGFYVWIKHAIEAFKRGSLILLRQEINEEAVLVTSDPKAWIRAQVGQSGKADFALDVGLSAVMVPLSLLAIKAGVEETHEALEQHAELTSKHNEITDNLKALNNKTQPTPIFKKAIKIETQDLNAIDNALKHNFYNGGIGCNSLLSGGAILTRVVQETILKAVSACTTQTGALTAATAVIGVIGTVVLGPIAALAAVCMGSFFVHQGRKVAEELAHDRELIDVHQVQSIESEKAFHRFINKEFTARESFTNSFKRWNIGFLAGACCYALSATAKAAIGIAALAGATTILATPAGLAVILVLGIVGGIGMTMCSWQFLVCHGKSKKHQNDRHQESPFLGRRFDALQTVTAEHDVYLGAKLRGALYRFVVRRDEATQKFLSTIAKARNKFYQGERTDNDDSSRKKAVDAPARKKQPFKTLFAQLSWVHTYFSQRLTGCGHQQALHAAHKIFGLQSDNLTVFDLIAWFDEPANESNQRTLLTNILLMQRRFLTKKMHAFKEFRRIYFKDGVLPEEVQKTFAQVQLEYQLDKVRLKKIEDLLIMQNKVAITTLQKEFLQLEGATIQDLPDDQLNARLAKHFIEELSEERATTQGILFDMHRRAFLLRNDIITGS